MSARSRLLLKMAIGQGKDKHASENKALYSENFVKSSITSDADSELDKDGSKRNEISSDGKGDKCITISDFGFALDKDEIRNEKLCFEDVDKYSIISDTNSVSNIKELCSCGADNSSVIYDTDSASSIFSSMKTSVEPSFHMGKNGSIYFDNMGTTLNTYVPENFPDVELSTVHNNNFPEQNRGGNTDKILDIYDFSERSPEGKTSKQVIIETKNTCDNEYAKPIFLDFDVEQQNGQQIIEQSENDNSIHSEFTDNDRRDSDFDINSFSESSDADSPKTVSETELYEIPNINPNKNKEKIGGIITQTLSESLKEQRKNYHNKKVRCKFCNEDISSRNFVRHLKRHHNHEKEIKNIFELPTKSKERKQALLFLKNSTNFDLYLQGTIRPKKQQLEDKQIEYYPCAYCKCLCSKRYLFRHAKICPVRKSALENKTKSAQITLSQTTVACALDTTNIISKLDIKEKVFDMMRGDDISFVAKKDLLIVQYGDSYLKSQKRERKEYSCSNKMRELARLLMTYRTYTNDNTVSFKDLIHPEKFDAVVSATRILAGFDPVDKSYKVPSLALHMGTMLKVAADELNHLILKRSPGFSCESLDKSTEWRKAIKNFKKLVESRWNTEISSVAYKDLNEKRWQKPLLVPLISDIKIFRENALEYGEQCEKQFLTNSDTQETYQLLVYCTLALLVLFNRRRIGDVQYLKINDYLSDRKTDFQDFEATLSEGEKLLTKRYRRVLNGGKGSRSVVILVPEILQRFINLLLEKRNKYIDSENNYVFAIPKSKIKWAQGDVAIRFLIKKMKLENPVAISSNKLRKHIATTMQILNMSKNDYKQFSKFMGHTEKTHEDFYELPVDIYQTAKVVKLLIMMEKGIPVEYQGKSLSEIEIDMNELFDEDRSDLSLNISDHEQKNIESTSDYNLNNKRDLLDTNSDVDGEPLSGKKHKLEQIKKQAWSTTEIATLQKHFTKYIDEGIYPSASKIKDFIQIENSARTVPVIKAKLQHIMMKRKH